MESKQYNYMATPTKLQKIGMEGFDLINKYYGPTNKMFHPEELVIIINSKQESNYYSAGVSSRTYPKTNQGVAQPQPQPQSQDRWKRWTK
ncbi:hypothetical protein O6P43_003588 [Quillaja saponaria]|uniref:Uncharacterized protein n=1 Tax=Quillaja saponaria TaxID=32244 RepID=A0AAD7QFD8_QUISA|nr:hypothetical protein O6P43_003588 [Quillaja saponaria]